MHPQANNEEEKKGKFDLFLNVPEIFLRKKSYIFIYGAGFMKTAPLVYILIYYLSIPSKQVAEGTVLETHGS